MSTTIKVKRSAVLNAVPTTGQLVAGELALNTNDGKLFILLANNTIATFTMDSAQTILASQISNATIAAGSSVSGNNNGDQTITLTGPVTGSGTGSFATTITNNAVSNAKLAQMPALTIKANNTGSTANALDLTTTQVKALLAIANTDITGLGTMSTQNASAVAITGGTITGLGTPTTSSDAATKAYVDAATSGLSQKASSRVATTAALTVTYANGASGVGATLTNAGAQVAIAIDGVTLALNDRVLVHNQASVFQNGIYTVTTLGSGSTNWVLTRAVDYDQTSEIVEGTYTVIAEGAVNQGTLWLCTTLGAVTVGTTNLVFTQLAVAPQTVTFTNDVVGTGAGNIALTISANAVTNAKLATMANNTIKGNVSGGSASPSDLSNTQVKTMLAIAASDVSGLAASATTNALNASNISSGILSATLGGIGTVNGIVKGNGAGTSTAASAGTDYSLGTSAIGTGIVKTTTGTGALTVAIAADFPVLNQNSTGNSATATTLQTARNINGVSFNGSADITVTAAAATLTGTTLASGVTASSLITLGALTDITTNNVSITAHGFAPKLSNDVTTFLNGQGAYTVPIMQLQSVKVQNTTATNTNGATGGTSFNSWNTSAVSNSSSTYFTSIAVDGVVCAFAGKYLVSYSIAATPGANGRLIGARIAVAGVAQIGQAGGTTDGGTLSSNPLYWVGHTEVVTLTAGQKIGLITYQLNGTGTVTTTAATSEMTIVYLGPA